MAAASELKPGNKAICIVCREQAPTENEIKHKLGCCTCREDYDAPCPTHGMNRPK